jgi:hypothetical protein
MFRKLITNGIHLALILGSLYSLLVLTPRYWIPIIVVSAAIHVYFRQNCLGLYYDRAEKMDVQILRVGPEEIDNGR